MAVNTYIKPTVIAATALGLLERNLVLGRVVRTKAGADFKGALNDTVTLRIPAKTAARTNALRATGSGRQITVDTMSQLSIGMALTDHTYNAIAITDEELTLDIRDFGQEILLPQVKAIAKAIDGKIATTMAAANYPTANVVQFNASNPWGSVLDVRKVLNDADNDAEGRVWVMGSAIERLLLDDKRFTTSDVGGMAAEGAIADAFVRRAGGFTFLTSNAIDPYVAFAVTPNAFSAAFEAPAVPEGAPWGHSMTYNGLALRWLKDYDSTNLTDRSILSVFAGYKSIEDATDASNALLNKNNRAVKITLAPFGS